VPVSFVSLAAGFSSAIVAEVKLVQQVSVQQSEPV